MSWQEITRQSSVLFRLLTHTIEAHKKKTDRVTNTLKDKAISMMRRNHRRLMWKCKKKKKIEAVILEFLRPSWIAIGTF